jgi:RimJ/RimL family protein N-acetyltransferase
LRCALEKSSFQREGTLRDSFYVGGEYVDRIVSGLLAQEFEE